MEVTEVRVFPVQEERLKAYVAITFDHCFVLRDLKVIDGNNGLVSLLDSVISTFHYSRIFLLTFGFLT